MPIFKAIQNGAPLGFLFLGNNGYLPAKLDAFPSSYKAARRFITLAPAESTTEQLIYAKSARSAGTIALQRDLWHLG